MTRHEINFGILLSSLQAAGTSLDVARMAARTLRQDAKAYTKDKSDFRYITEQLDVALEAVVNAAVAMGVPQLDLNFGALCASSERLEPGDGSVV